MKQIGWRVVYRDVPADNFVAMSREGQNLSGESTAGELLETLESNLGKTLDIEGVKAWLADQEPAQAGDSAIYPLTDSMALEIVVKLAEA